LGLLQRLAELVPTGFSRVAKPAKSEWPVIAGKYVLLSRSAPVVVATLAGEQLNDNLAALAPQGLCMIAPLRSVTDAEKLVRNVAANLSVQHLLVTGPEAKSQPLGAALLALLKGSAVDLDEAGTALVQSLKTRFEDDELAALRKQVSSADLLGCEDIDKVLASIGSLAAASKRPNTGFVAPPVDGDEDGVQRVIVAENSGYEWAPDKAGGFEIKINGKAIVVEHFSPKEQLLRVIEGVSARDICLTLIRNGWVSKLDHAAYLGYELMRAEAALRSGGTFVQDRRPATPVSQ
jgi:tetrahydromethanopterin S-methyltransferase subunit A